MKRVRTFDKIQKIISKKIYRRYLQQTNLPNLKEFFWEVTFISLSQKLMTGLFLKNCAGFLL